MVCLVCSLTMDHPWECSMSARVRAGGIRAKPEGLQLVSELALGGAATQGARPGLCEDSRIARPHQTSQSSSSRIGTIDSSSDGLTCTAHGSACTFFLRHVLSCNCFGHLWGRCVVALYPAWQNVAATMQLPLGGLRHHGLQSQMMPSDLRWLKPTQAAQWNELSNSRKDCKRIRIRSIDLSNCVLR